MKNNLMSKYVEVMTNIIFSSLEFSIKIIKIVEFLFKVVFYILVAFPALVYDRFASYSEAHHYPDENNK